MKRYLDRIDCRYKGIVSRPVTGFSLGNLNVLLQGPGIEKALRPGPYRSFLTDRMMGKALRIELIQDAGNFMQRHDLAFHAQDAFQLFLAPRFSLVLDTENWRAWAFAQRVEYVTIDQIVRLCIILYASSIGCFFIHGCAINYRERGFLFTGKSGAGKTTLANSSDRFEVLNDEMVMVDVSNPYPLLCGTPFLGRSPNSKWRTGHVKAEGLFFLVQSNLEALTPMPAAKAMVLLGQTVFHPRTCTGSMERTLDLIASFTARVPSYSMEFTRSDRFLELLDCRFCDQRN